MRHEIDWGISDVSAALGDSKYLAPFFRIPGLARSDLVESELAARGLTIFSSDADADDWHHRISGQQIIALAMRRLEARGKGILLLHDIHPATVAALPGLLKELKDKGFHIVQVVPAASYVIAMANKPKARTLASTLPREPTISDDGNRGAQPHWPHVVASVAPDHSVLPVPDASAFEPDAVASQDITDVHWPAQAEAKRPSPAKSQVLAPRKHKFAFSSAWRPRTSPRSWSSASLTAKCASRQALGTARRCFCAIRRNVEGHCILQESPGTTTSGTRRSRHTIPTGGRGNPRSVTLSPPLSVAKP
jgi:hypothetical protein